MSCFCFWITRRYASPFHFSARMELSSNSIPFFLPPSDPWAQRCRRRANCSGWHGYRRSCSVFLLLPQYRVGTTGAKCRVKREVAHQMSRYILNTWAATEVNAHKWTDDFAVLITIQPASHTEGWVDYRWEIGVKLLHYWKNSSKRREFLRFYCYLCHVCRVWYIFWFATLR